MPPQHYFLIFRDRLVQSRFFTISLLLHLILVTVVGTTVFLDRTVPPPRIEASLLPKPPIIATSPPAREMSSIINNAIVNPAPLSPPINTDIIRSTNPTQTVDLPTLPKSSPVQIVELPQPTNLGDQLSAGDRQNIQKFAEWREPSRGTDAFAFTAYVGRYHGGDWSATVRLQNGEITGGSLPNLLYAMSKWSKDKIKTNERAVRSVALDSPELLTTKPPFVFLTGTQNFKLTDKEIENLRLYIRTGGAVWGDSSVPGRRSAFDIAFRREMSRVLPDTNQQFEALPENHEIFAHGYYKQIKGVPGGINHYKEPVEVLRWSGEIAVVHTLNDYGDMWQVGLDKNGQIDTSRNGSGEFVAMNRTLWENRGSYVRNIEQPEVEQAYQFGINIVIHLLTRWEDRLSVQAPL